MDFTNICFNRKMTAKKTVESNDQWKSISSFPNKIHITKVTRLLYDMTVSRVEKRSQGILKSNIWIDNLIRLSFAATNTRCKEIIAVQTYLLLITVKNGSPIKVFMTGAIHKMCTTSQSELSSRSKVTNQVHINARTSAIYSLLSDTFFSFIAIYVKRLFRFWTRFLSRWNLFFMVVLFWCLRPTKCYKYFSRIKKKRT